MSELAKVVAAEKSAAEESNAEEEEEAWSEQEMIGDNDEAVDGATS